MHAGDRGIGDNGENGGGSPGHDRGQRQRHRGDAVRAF